MTEIESPKEMETEKVWKKEGKSLLCWLLLIAAVLGCNFFVARLAFVYGASMEPTLQQYDCLVVWQAGYVPKAGDIVVTTADNQLGQSIIKRVVATEGQSFSYEQGGQQIEGIVPEGQVFLMGDNREHSKDSRELGCFAVEEIMGRAVLRIFPFTKITTL